MVANAFHHPTASHQIVLLGKLGGEEHRVKKIIHPVVEMWNGDILEMPMLPF